MESYIIPGIIIGIAAFFVYTYNRLISLRNMTNNAWANIDTLLQKRFDLVPNLVNTVKGYMEHEREVLEAITRARAAWMSAASINDNAGADRMATGALQTLFAVAENYPELKANQNFLLLQEELAGIENKIAYARRRYNTTAMVFNTAIMRFPTNLLARLFNFKPMDYYTLESAQAREAPAVNLEGGGKS